MGWSMRGGSSVESERSLLPQKSGNGRRAVTETKGGLVDVEGDGRFRRLVSIQERFSGEITYSLRNVILPFIFPALGGILFGFNIGATSGAVLSMTSEEMSGTTWYSLSKSEQGLVVSGPLYGALVGSALAFTIADLLGRRRELILAAVTYALGLVMMSLAQHLTFLIAGRVVFGVAIGLAMHASPLYISETSPFRIRGTMVSLQEGVTVVGILIGYSVGSLGVEIEGGWRVMFASAIPVAFVMGLGVWTLPPSPRWILLRAVRSKGDFEDAKVKARIAIYALRGQHVCQGVVEAELEETLTSLETSAGGQEEITFVEIFQGKLNQKAFVIGGGLVVLQQVTGQPSVLYYAAQIIQSAGFSAASEATKISVILGIFKLLMTGVAIYNVDKLGRRPLLLTGISGIVLSLFALAASYSFASGIPSIAVIALIVFVGSYQVSFGPISYLIASEVFPLRTRGRAMSLTTLMNFAANAAVAFSFPIIQDRVGPSATFLLFGVIAIFSLAFVYVYVPETKGLTLEEVEDQLSS